MPDGAWCELVGGVADFECVHLPPWSADGMVMPPVTRVVYVVY
jgi:hypothetical protein